MAYPRGESGSDAVRLDFDRRLMLQFRGGRVVPAVGIWSPCRIRGCERRTENFAGLADLSGQWIDLVHGRRKPRGICSTWIQATAGDSRCRRNGRSRCSLQLHALAYNLGNFLRTLATPEPIKEWSLTSLKEKLIKIGAKVVSHGRYVVFQMAEVAIARQMLQEILRLIAELRPRPPPALA
jgi:hypothetical protein